MNVSKIKVLSPELVHRIAAGEVVESPAAAMKELIENSIDAGADKVAALIMEGGLKLIEIKDNGMGMSRADLETCCQRHATSKIHELADLDNIFSLGFRGEALAALSSVSHLEILSTERGSAEAWLLKRQGSFFATEPVSHKTGTIVRVRDLFFNTPARKKFLKSTSSEASQCVRVFKELAVAHPGVELSLHLLNASGEVDEDLVFPRQSRLERVAAVLSKESEYFFLSPEPDVALVSGLKGLELVFLKPPHFARNSKDIFFVVNQRPVEDKRLGYVLREAFGGLIEMGVFPRGAVFIDVDTTEVDVNVHPQKKELRWSKEFPLYSLIFEECKRNLARVLRTTAPSPVGDTQIAAPLGNFQNSFQNSFQNNFQNNQSSVPATTLSLGEVLGRIVPMGAASTSSGSNSVLDSNGDSTTHSTAHAIANSTVQFSYLRVVGKVGAAWLLCESEKGLVVIDQHAAHERVRFDEFIKGTELFSPTPLLLPLVVELPLFLRGREEELVTLLESWAFEGRVTGDLKVEFFAVPQSPRKVDWKHTFAEIFDRLDQKESVESLQRRLKIWIASSLACHGSVRRGQRLTAPEITELLKKMDAVDWKEFCPHGRPTWIEFSHDKLAEEFHRS